MSSQIISRAINSQGPCMELRGFLAPTTPACPPAHLCHLPFLALHRLQVCQRLCHQWRAYRLGPGRKTEGEQVLSPSRWQV